MPDHAYIVYHRRSGEKRAYGQTEVEAWQALVRIKHPDYKQEELLPIILYQKKLDHKALHCGGQGARIWADNLSLVQALLVTSRAVVYS
jgi:hypothetical protein